MTMQECYKAIGGNYEAVLGRLHSEALIQRFTLKFLEDQSYLQLKQTLENKNYEDAFRSAHTLKGVCQNLSFDRLYEVSDKSLPNQIYSQNLIKVMQEKIDFFKSNSGMNSIDYNAVSGQLTILNGKRQILCQRNNSKIDLFKEFGVNEEEFIEKKHMIAERAVGDACTGSNPRETSVEDMEKILECIYYGRDVTF